MTKSDAIRDIVSQDEGHKRSYQIASALLALVVLLTLLHLPLLPAFYDYRISVQGAPFPAGIILLIDMLDMFYTVGMAALGFLLISSQRENRFAWLMLAIGLGSAILRLSGHYAFNAYIVYTGGQLENVQLPFAEFAAWLQHWLWVPIVIGLEGVGIPLLFPNGRLPSRWWWIFVLAVIGWLGFGTIVIAFHPFIPIENYFVGSGLQPANPFASQAVANFVEPVFFTLAPRFLEFAYYMVLIANLSLLVRFIRAEQKERQQIKWFSYVVVLMGLLFIMRNNLNAINTVDGFPAFVEFTFLLVNSSMPIILGVAIFRYQLWDIDTVINRTLVYAILTTALIIIYLVVLAAIASVIGTTSNLQLSIVATLIVAASFQFLREGIQKAINRLMFGQRDEPQAILLELVNQLNTAIRPQELLQLSVSTIAHTLRLPYVAISIRQGVDDMTQTSFGSKRTPTQSFPLFYQNEDVGALIVGQRSTNEALAPADNRTLVNIAQQMGAVAYALRLQSDLQIARERLVIAREEERRRIRRDLHDGLGPALASQPLKIDSAIDLVKINNEQAIELLSNIKKQSQSLVADIRRLVHDLRPPALDDLGLVEALRTSISQIGSSKQHLDIHFHVKTDLPPLSAAVEVAVYRIVMEAATNVFKHADARNCDIRFEVLDEQALQISIEDDGVGLAEFLTAGVGLHSMRERCEELGGTFTIEANTPKGTQVLAMLPLTRKESE